MTILYFCGYILIAVSLFYLFAKLRAQNSKLFHLNGGNLLDIAYVFALLWPVIILLPLPLLISYSEIYYNKLVEHFRFKFEQK